MIIKRTSITANKNYLSIETTGLSPKTDSIILLALLDCQRGCLDQYLAENLKDEALLLEKLYHEYKNKTFFTWEGNNFIHRFFHQKEKLYGLKRNFQLSNLSHMVKDYSYFFPQTSLNRRSMEEFFEIESSSFTGREVSSSFKEFLKSGERKNLERILEHNQKNIQRLIRLEEKLHQYIREKRNFTLGSEIFTLKSLKKEDQFLKIVAQAFHSSPYFASSHRYTLHIEEELTLEIPMERAPYDHRDCYFILNRDFPSFENKSSLPAPKAIGLLYLDDFIYENIIEVMKIILRERKIPKDLIKY